MKKPIRGIAKKNKEEKQKRLIESFKIAESATDEIIVIDDEPVQVEYTKEDRPFQKSIDISTDKAVNPESIMEIGGQDGLYIYSKLNGQQSMHLFP